MRRCGNFEHSFPCRDAAPTHLFRASNIQRFAVAPAAPGLGIRHKTNLNLKCPLNVPPETYSFVLTDEVLMPIGSYTPRLKLVKVSPESSLHEPTKSNSSVLG
jgi:hypothetical protein